MEAYRRKERRRRRCKNRKRKNIEVFKEGNED